MLIFANILVQMVISFTIAIIASFLTTPIAKPLGLMDNPGTAPHKLHTVPTPLAGGMVIGLSVIILILLLPELFQGDLRAMVVGATVILAFGLWDDISGLGAGPKFFGQFLAAVIVLVGGISIDIIPSSFFNGNQMVANLANHALTIFWLVGITNAFNLIDSMDGIVAGLSTIAGILFILVTYISGQPTLTMWAVMITGISLALYLWNSPPARYFLGDSGAQTLGFLLAILALLYTPGTKVQASSWFVPILILGVPIFDTCLVVFSRVRRHSPPFEGNRDHTYHRLIQAGLKPARAVNLIHLVAVIVDCTAIFALYQNPLAANLIFAICLACAAFLLITFEYQKRFIHQPASASEIMEND